MAKNLIPEIAKMLGVELGEEFKIKSREVWTYKFEDNRLRLVGDDTKMSYETANTLAALLNGEYEIVKLPWKPKREDTYYSFYNALFKYYGYERVREISEYCWSDSPLDFALLKMGWVFRTREEAKAALPKVAKELGKIAKELGVDY